VILPRVLADPQRALSLDTAGWSALLCTAHAERLSGTLASRLAGLPIPGRAAEILETARLNAAAARTRALWEVEMARRALLPLGIPVILLKGSAFLAAGLDAGQGRLVGDLDILVPRDALAQVEDVLLAAGWEWLKTDAYDDAYYRRWMHELPPMIHRDRDAMIDVHHTILPLTARPRPDAAALIADSVLLENGLRVLCPADMVVHAAAHLLADGDLGGGLRNLWDIDRLVRASDLSALPARARHHGLSDAVERALTLAHHLFDTPIAGRRPRRSDRIFVARLTARDGWGRETRPLLRFAFYLRSHLIRMPLPLLVAHLWTKWRKGRARG